ncbi:MAG: sodium:proton antiporter, partial [Myxococcales bacterium]
AEAPQRGLVEQAAVRFRAFRQSPDVEVGRSAKRELTRAVSVNERLQAALHPWASYVVVPLFAFANAGVDLRDGVLGAALSSRLTWTVVGALVLGKLIGVGVSSSLGVRAGLGSLPRGVHQRHVFGGAALSGIGFTVSLLIAGLAFDDPTQRDEAIVGVLIAAVLATALGALVFRGQSDADLPRVLDREVDVAFDHLRGPAEAPLTLIEYGDFECPFCARATGVGRELREHFGDDLRYVFRHLPLVDVHPHAVLAAKASMAASLQGRYWDMHDQLFEHYTDLEYEDLIGHANAIGLDVDAFVEALDSEQIADRIRADVASAEASGARGTPTFFIGGRRHTGPHDTATLIAALEASRRA